MKGNQRGTPTSSSSNVTLSLLRITAWAKPYSRAEGTGSGACGELGAFGAHGLLRPVPLTTQGVPKTKSLAPLVPRKHIVPCKEIRGQKKNNHVGAREQNPPAGIWQQLLEAVCERKRPFPMRDQQTAGTTEKNAWAFTDQGSIEHSGFHRGGGSPPPFGVRS